MVAPFLGPLKKWIAQRREQKGQGYESTTNARAAEPQKVHHQEDPQSAIQLSIPVNPPDDDYEQQSSMQHTNETASHATVNPGLDAAAHLKGLLGVVSPNQPQPKQPVLGQAASGSSRLLALLNNKVDNRTSGINAGLPRTSMNRVDIPRADPRSSHRVNEQPPLLSHLASPPSFPIYPSNSTFVPRNGEGAYSMAPAQTSFYGGTQNVTQDHQRDRLRLSSDRLAQARGVIQQPQDSQLSSSTGMENQHLRSAPSASQLPAPKLSSHAQTLLDAFKPAKSRALAVSAPSETSSPASILDLAAQSSIPLVRQSVSTLSAVASGPPSEPNRNEQLLNLLRSGSNQSVATPLQRATKPGMQQNVLLSLFRPSPKSEESQVKTTSPSRAPGPATTPIAVELATTSSPSPRSKRTEPPQLDVEKPAKERRPLASRHAARRGASPNSTKISSAAIVSESMDVPDNTGTVRRKPRQPRQHTVQPEKPLAMTILKRTTDTTHTYTTMPVAPAAKEIFESSATITARPKTTTPKPFQPQILRRPHTNDSPSPSARLASDKEVVVDQATPQPAVLQHYSDAFVSLSARPAPVAEQSDDAAALVSPLSIDTSSRRESADPASASARGRLVDSVRNDARSPTVALSRSRINSIASAPRPGSAKPVERGGGGGSTPMSPLDRGFLLNFLDGVVKSAGASR